jgi:hypothetical protein
MTRKQPGRKGFDLDYNEISKEYLDGITLKNLASKQQGLLIKRHFLILIMKVVIGQDFLPQMAVLENINVV